MGASSQTNLCEKSTTSFFRMIFLALVLVTPTFFYGLNLSYTTVAMPQMDLSIGKASWFASVSIYASPISTIIVGFLIDKYGRRTALLYSLLPSLIGYSLLFWSANIHVILLGQMFNGLTMGAGAYPGQVYAGECVMVNNVRWRNIFMTWMSVSSSLGTLIMLLMANFFDYRRISAISAILSAFSLTIFYFVIPESPLWLYRKGRIGDAEWSQKKLGIMQPILQESDPLSSEKGESETVQSGSILIRQMRVLTRPDVYKPIIILSIASTVLSFCGTVTVSTYMINIIDNTIPGVVSSDPPETLTTNLTNSSELILPKSYQYSLISGLGGCLGSLISIWVFPRMGLKKMLMTSKVFIIAGLVTLTYATLTKGAINAFLRTAAVTLLSFLMGLELGPRMSFAGDVFPSDAKGFASVPSLTGSIASATANKIFPYLRVVFGGYAFLFYASASVFGIVYIHFFLPEVVGRTLDEINRDYKKVED